MTPPGPPDRVAGPSTPESLLIVGGGGAVGRLFGRSLDDRYQVRSLDLEAGPDVDLVEDACGEAAVRAVRQSNIILLCLPESAAEDAVAAYAEALSEEQLLVDTLSVKSGYLAAVVDLGIPSQVLSLNPMFAPDLGFEGRSVASIVVRGGDRCERFREALRHRGATFVEVAADEHDRLTAALQTAGHAAVIAFGRALRSLGYDAERMRPLWTPPHRLLLALLARMGSIDPEVYRDIQVGNPAAAEARAGLDAGLEEIERTIESPEAFARLMEEALEPLGGLRDELGALALELFRRS